MSCNNCFIGDVAGNNRLQAPFDQILSNIPDACTCHSRCQSTSQCEFCVWNSGTCYLTSSGLRTGPQTGYITGFLNSETTLSDIPLTSNGNNVHNLLSSPAIVSSPAACKTLCVNTTGCFYFAYNPSNGYCMPKRLEPVGNNVLICLPGVSASSTTNSPNLATATANISTGTTTLISSTKSPESEENKVLVKVKSNTSSDDNNNNTILIAGFAASVVIAVAIIAVIVCLFLKRRQRRNNVETKPLNESFQDAPVSLYGPEYGKTYSIADSENGERNMYLSKNLVTVAGHD
ncbi:hypothetical protein HK098_004856 [Nowakowskiella sp. JEL0407]|nr:hypothetical protein HK098_004856 [Nowakowskiella sp. JEL0407]